MKNPVLLFLLTILSLQVKSQIASMAYNDEAGIPVIKVKVDGKECNFIFDTGAEVTIVNTTLITKTNGKKIKAKDAGNKQSELTAVTLSSIEAGENGSTVLRGFKAYATALDNGSFTCNRIDGILGADFFSRYIIEIDPRKKLIQFYDNGDQDLLKASGTEFSTVTYQQKRGRVWLQIKIGDNNEDLLIDSGSSGFITLNKDQIPKFLHTEKKKISGYGAVSLFGQSKTNSDSYWIDQYPIQLPGDSNYTPYPLLIKEAKSNKLGFLWLKQHHVFFFPKGKTLAYKRVKNHFLYNSTIAFGFSAYTVNGSCIITEVLDTETGINLNDRIILLNGLPATEYCNINQYLTETKKVTMLLERNGEQIQIERTRQL
jgi:hypothetical protein